MVRPGDTTIVLDAGAILGLARGNRALRAFMSKADERGVEPTARLAGALLAAARSSSTIDALVVAEAINRQPSLLVTSDVADLALLLDGRPGVSLERI